MTFANWNLKRTWFSWNLSHPPLGYKQNIWPTCLNISRAGAHPSPVKDKQITKPNSMCSSWNTLVLMQAFNGHSATLVVTRRWFWSTLKSPWDQKSRLGALLASHWEREGGMVCNHTIWCIQIVLPCGRLMCWYPCLTRDIKPQLAQSKGTSTSRQNSGDQLCDDCERHGTNREYCNVCRCTFCTIC